MNTILRRAALLAGAALLLLACAAAAGEKIAAETKLACVSCHDKPGSRLLTDQGKYFETQRTLAGFDQLKGTFGRCTSCHVRKPGSAKLTKKGRQFAELVKDMAGLQEWMQKEHPATERK